MKKFNSTENPSQKFSRYGGISRDIDLRNIKTLSSIDSQSSPRRHSSRAKAEDLFVVGEIKSELH